MDELELLIALIVGLFKLVRWVLKTLFRTLFGIFGFFKRAQSGQISRAAPLRAVPKKSPPAQVPPTARPVPAGAGPAIKQLVERLGALAKSAADEAERCLDEEPNLGFVDSLRWVCDQATRVAQKAQSTRDGQALGAAFAAAEQLESLLEIYTQLANQRRSPTLLDLLGDADALAEASYRPIVEYCRQRAIKLVSDRTATCIGGDKLFILSVDDPSGLAPIVLPEDWATQIGWWPALAHEIGHDFLNSVANLNAELRRELSLPSGPGKLSSGGVRQGDLDAAVGAWMEELFADAFGTMMLGPAFVATMRWSFGSPKEPVRVLAIAPTPQKNNGGGYEEHPPAHVRVACACRLLGKMGYGALGDRLEEGWRRMHNNPSQLYLPTRGNNWIAVSDEVVIERALEVASTLYETGLPSLAGFPLRSIPGLDFGPREHEVAQKIKQSLLAGRRPTVPGVRDPRLVIAGSVLAWSEKPADNARILSVARDLIDGVGVPRRRPKWAGDADRDDEAAPAISTEAALWRDAIILDALLQRRSFKR